MVWSLYESRGIGGLKGEERGEEKEAEYLQPMVFSNGKTQEDVVKEVIQAVGEGHKVIFIKGVCGTGKSAIALNLAKELGRASIVVPVKGLQKQYEEDYTNKKYLLKENGQKLNIKVITGRANFACPFFKEEGEDAGGGAVKTGMIKQNAKKEIDSKLTDFQELLNQLEESTQEAKGQEARGLETQRRGLQNASQDDSCDNSQLPCKIEIKERNINQIRAYLRKNPLVASSNFSTMRHIRRMSIAPVCSYWSPIIPSESDFRILGNVSIKTYRGLNNTIYSICQRKKGCGYYDQYQAYADADAIIFNSQKYKLETIMNRKPATNVEIIDECDEFLDSFSNQKEIDINRLNFALGGLFAYDEKSQKIIDELIELTAGILKDRRIGQYVLSDEIIPLKDTQIFSLLQKFLDSDFMGCVECDEENYCYHVDETARIFKDFVDETYISFHKSEKNLVVKLVTTNLEKMFKEMLDKNRVFVMMSGTIHSEKVLKEVFGLLDFKIIEAETNSPGKIDKLLTGAEVNCRYDNFAKGGVTRKQYLDALQECITRAELPALVHVNSFSDLPSEQEAREYGLKIMTREKLLKLQTEDSTGRVVQQFKSGQIKVLYSTKCNRGVDFPGETCNSIILTKYPYPNIKSLFWRILKKIRPQHYNSFYTDKARREFFQRIYRGLRSKHDHIFLLSPDIRVFNKLGGD